MLKIKIKKGLDIQLSGSPEQIIDDAPQVKHVALLTSDFNGLKAKLLVKPGDTVGLGQALFFNKKDSLVQFTAPGNGKIVEINVGARRALQSVVIELDNEQDDELNNNGLDKNSTAEKHFTSFKAEELAQLDEGIVREILLRSGMWTTLRTRPNSQIPHSQAKADAIFVTAIDTQPLAADPQVILKEHQQAFNQGLCILTRLTSGTVFLCTGQHWSADEAKLDRLQRVEFSGPHPAGLVGTHIHHLFPVDAKRSVWHIGYQDVIAIGKLFTSGRIWSERVIALAGPAVARPRLLRTRSGASFEEILANEVDDKHDYRGISGSVLTGHTAQGPHGFLGHYHQQITLIHKCENRSRLFGWLRKPLVKELFSTNLHGRPTAMIPVGDFERVMPLDILPSPLLRALLVKDTDLAQDLGCLELDEEDLALCSYVCPAKHDYGAVLRLNLKQIERDG